MGLRSVSVCMSFRNYSWSSGEGPFQAYFSTLPPFKSDPNVQTPRPLVPVPTHCTGLEREGGTPAGPQLPCAKPPCLHLPELRLSEGLPVAAAGASGAGRLLTSGNGCGTPPGERPD